ncbi:MAG: hypothetical protein ACTSRP_04390 [Candidatus Helarchaeota archaeon]
MTFGNKSIKKIATIFLMFLILIPFNTFFINKPINTNNSNDLIANEKEEENLKNPSLSALDLGYELKINDSKIYPNGTFYLYRGDYLYFELINKSAVSNVRLIIQALSVNQLFTQSGNKFTLTRNFDYAAGIYPSKVSFIKNSKTIEINFYLDIDIFGPQILEARAKDTKYNTQWTKIYEGGIYSVYRNTYVEFEVKTYNREAPASSLKLKYNDGISFNSLDGVVSATSGNIRNFTFSQSNGNAIKVYINTTSGYEERWKLTDQLYTFQFNASYGNKYYLFEFYLEILNKPPKITKFDITPSIVENPVGTTTSVVITANASDFEDDILWYRNSIRSARYTDRVTAISNNSGCKINAPLNDSSLTYLQTEDNNYYDNTFLSGGEGEFLMFVKINQDINISYIQWLQTDLLIRDAVSGNIDGRFDVWNYVTNSWNMIANLSKIVNDWTNVINRTDILGLNILNLIPKSNYTLKFRIYYNSTSDISVYIDKFTVTTQVQRRETFSRVILYIINPRGTSVETIELVNYWDNTQKLYWYKKNINNIEGNYGSWTFQIRFFDHGSLDYHDMIWGNFSGGLSSSPKESHNYGYNLFNPTFSSSVGQAMATKIFALGISKSEALNVTGIPYSNSTNDMNPMHNESISLNINVNGIDTSSYNEYHKVYSLRKRTSEFRTQKNTSYSTEFGDSPKIVSGSLKNITLDDNIAYQINLDRDLESQTSYITALWRIYVLDRAGLTYENISKIYIDLDNWFNDTSLIQDVYFEFYNYTSDLWTVPSTGTWSNDSNLKTTSKDLHFKRILSNKNDFLNFIESGVMTMRLRIVPKNPGVNQDIRLDIDFLNITVEFDYHYIANITLLGSSSLDQSEKDIKLTPTVLGAWSVRYSCKINIYQLGLEPDIFSLQFVISNGNSSISYVAFRKAPRVILGSNLVKKFVSYYYFDQSEEINYLNKNFTLSIREPNYTLSKDIIFKNFNKISSTTSDNILFIRNRDQLRANASLNLGTLNENNPNLEFKVQIKEGLTETRSLWTIQTASKTGTNLYSFIYDITDSDNYDFYFIRYYFRSPFGQEFTTNWKEFRIINFQPVDFAFDFDNGNPINLYRNQQYSFTFSFLDYDMTDAWASSHLNKITIRFLVNNKSNGNTPEWIYANIDGHTYSANIHSYSCHIDIPLSIQTGPNQMTYYNWQFLVEDEDDTESFIQYQKSFINYTDTNFTIINRAPSITSLTLNDQAAGVQISRHSNVTIKFSIQDVDEPSSGLYLEVVYLNISTPPSMYNINVDNASVKVVGSHREYTYYVNRSATIAQYNISIKIIDSDGRTAEANTYFLVINSPPKVNSITFSQNQIYRNLDGNPPDYGPVIFYVNVSDAEDSYFGDNASASVTLIIDNVNPYRAKIQEISKALPVKLNLSLKYNGNATNGNTELWVGQYQFNETVNGQKLYAGVLRLLANVTDGEGASGTMVSTDFELYNYKPEKHSELDTEIGMEDASTYYVKESINEGEDIEIYIFVSDKEGLADLKLWYIPYVGTPGQEIQDKAKTITLTSQEWNAELFDKTGTTEIYKIKIVIPYEDLPDDTVKVEINDLVVYDNDYGYKDDTYQGATSITFKEIQGIQIEINITSKPPTTPVVIYILMGVGIALLGIVVVVGVVYYRKRTGYRKFLD